eukprot:1743926-Prorocentrum_lima.AAC.1
MGASVPLVCYPALPGYGAGYRCLLLRLGKGHTPCPASSEPTWTVKWLAGFMTCTAPLAGKREALG